VLLLFGLAVLSSAGVVDGQKRFGSPYYYLYNQLLKGVLPGLLFMFLLSKFDYRHFKKFSLLILFGALVLMVLVLIPQFGIHVKGAQRWLSFFGYSFQPSEVLKLALIIYLAAWFGNRDSRMKDWTYGTAPFFIVLSFVALLLILQPDFGTLMITIGIAVSMYFLAGVEMKKFAAIILIFATVAGGAAAFTPHGRSRLNVFFNRDKDVQGNAYQLNQSLIAIGSGGMFGVGYGKSTQKFGFLPEVVNDSIFAVIVEELGFVGGAVTVMLYLALFSVMTVIAAKTSDQFGKLLVLGIGVWITGQAFVNIAAISGMLPLTGIPLPFISYGGTALIMILSGMGIVLNIARRA
jgi:cell division protein FtsW